MAKRPAFDSNITVRVNLIRALAAGLVWGILFATGLFALGVFSWFTRPQGEWLTLILMAPTAGVVGLFMPLSFLLITVAMDTLLAPVNKDKVLGFLVGLVLPNASLLTALIMIVGDPLVYLIWRIAPSWVPVTKYDLISFASYILVEPASSGDAARQTTPGM